MTILNAAECGDAAQRILASGEPASVIGLTSRGIFCATASGQVIFISFEAWRGPLTINLIVAHRLEPGQNLPPPVFQKGMPPFERVVQHSPVAFQAGQAAFVNEDIQVRTGHLAGWRSTWGALRGAITPAIRARYSQVAREVLHESENKGWSRLLDRESENLAGGDFERIVSDLDLFAKAVQSRDLEGAAFQAGKLVGRGSGLTPSGDDLITGFLLALSRLLGSGASILDISDFFLPLKARLIGLARQKTTWLAAALIECAAEGQADERLVTALDGVITGDLPPEECTRRLLAYGSSSGGDAWLGIGLGFTLI